MFWINNIKLFLKRGIRTQCRGLVKFVFPTPNYDFWAKMVNLDNSEINTHFYNMLGRSFIIVYLIKVKKGRGVLYG